jgi:Uma2 family endonuclease
MATGTVLMTAEEFLRLPDVEGVTRELIDGVVVERNMTTRSPRHTISASRISQKLWNWLDSTPGRRGLVAVGEVRCRLPGDPETVVGIDVAYFEGAEAERQGQEESSFVGPPILAVEILSPSDTHEDVGEKIHRYLAAGTKQVWIADPDFRTITVHRADAPPAFYHHLQDLPGGPDLPGLHVPVASLFGP